MKSGARPTPCNRNTKRSKRDTAPPSRARPQKNLECKALSAKATGESAEIRQLMGAVSLGDYLTPASAGSGIEGRARELNAALQVEAIGKNGGVSIPWAVLTGPTPAPEARSREERAFTDTGDYAGAVAQRPILQRLFGPGILDALGVRIDSVPSGRTEWPLLTGGVAPDQAVEGTAAADAVAASFSTETLKPKRLTGRYEYTHEQAAQVPDHGNGA